MPLAGVQMLAGKIPQALDPSTVPYPRAARADLGRRNRPLSAGPNYTRCRY